MENEGSVYFHTTFSRLLKCWFVGEMITSYRLSHGDHESTRSLPVHRGGWHEGGRNKQDHKFSVKNNHLFQMTQSYAGGLDQLNSLDRILVQ